MPAKRPVRRPMRVVGKEPRAAAVTPARIARSMDMTEARHLSEDEAARLLVALQAEYPELQGCEDWDTRLFKACREQLWDTVIPLLQYAAVLLALGRTRKGRRPNLDAIKYCLHNLGSWTVPTPVQVNTGDQSKRTNVLVAAGVSPDEARDTLKALVEAGVLE